MTIEIREPGSAFTHLLGMLFAVISAYPLLMRSAVHGNEKRIAGMAVFAVSMFLLYTASTLYHSVTVVPRVLKIFRKLDHMMIFVLIAGSYTPVCLLVLPPEEGRFLLAAVWMLAVVGMMVKMCWIGCPQWFSSVIYILMGWICLFVMKDLVGLLEKGAFRWLLAGGIVYTAGGIIYAVRLPLFPPKKYFGNHELFHLFVLGGSICHFMCMYLYLA